VPGWARAQRWRRAAGDQMKTSHTSACRCDDGDGGICPDWPRRRFRSAARAAAML
jgi:hypothetical protein